MTDADKELRKLRKKRGQVEVELSRLDIAIRALEAQVKAENGWKAAPQ